MKAQSNHQDLLKLIAVLAMTIDHIGLYFYPEQQILRAIGRLAMPIFCFFAGYNFHKRPKHLILILGILLYAITRIIFGKFQGANILISIYLGQWYIFLFDHQLKKFTSSYLHVIISGILFPYTDFLFEYGTLVITIMILGHIAKYEDRNRNLTVAITVILSLFHSFAIFTPTNTDLIITILIAISGYFLITARNFNQPINLKINVITRNILFVYFIQVVIIQCIWTLHKNT
ncbi:TraX superfamily domain protein [Candidatus Trichorickettsia mobilis]|uniref:TraX superfamily domain protein n=1 Tax=Candidatus Trichorickettsia mobilis TaxID=1346319 RepID=A0ABZ0UW00_9RICK|nr:TraX family protein [Candidatus Trichorickettsia mobilis]WPY01272.1 TraX superfamily domain protein [Candidatus Trichorickettsia mobilis]